MTKSRDLANIAQSVATNLPSAMGTAGQVVQVNSGANGLEFADASGGVTTYAQVSNMVAASASVGDQAYVTANNSLYIKNSTGWYRIAVINTTPTITSPVSATTALATSGAATSIELVITDGGDEGQTLQNSYAVSTGSLTNGGGTTATVTTSATSSGTYAGLAASTNTTNRFFKVTPTTTEAYEGDFTITFSSSDGINAGTTVQSFTLSFNPVKNAQILHNFGSYTNVGSGPSLQQYIGDHDSSYRKVGNRGFDTGTSGRGTALAQTGLSSSTTTYSMGCWVRLTHTNNQSERWVFGTSTGINSNRTQGMWWSQSNGRLYVYANHNYYSNGIYAAASAGAPNLSYSNGNSTNQWGHYVVTASPANGTKIYANGTLYQTDTGTPSPMGIYMVIGDNAFKWQNSGSNSGTNLKGSVDQVFAINSELDAAEIGLIYSRTTDWS